MLLLGLSPALTAPPALAAIFADRATIQSMLDIEAALADAEAACGVIPPEAAPAIRAACDAALYDPDALAQGARNGGTVALPVSKALADQVRRTAPHAAGWVHFGATSQDLVDTALILQLRTATTHLVASADSLAAHCRTLATTHRATPMLGRTLLQPGPPITFGLKAAGWLAAIQRGADRLRAAADDAFILQFGGAVGTLAALGDHALPVSEALAANLALPLPAAPWHAHRDRLAAFAAAVAILGGSCAKIARDVTLMMQAELAEAAEPAAPGRGGSSTMPHKRNPVGCVTALAAAHRLPGLLGAIIAGLTVEHERGAGPWQSEPGLHAEIVLATGAALAAMDDVCAGLAVDPHAMARNIEALRGLVMAERLMLALAPHLGRPAAHALVETLVARTTGATTLQQSAAADPQITAALPNLDAIFDPAGYLGATDAYIDRILTEPH